jgi:hypothetical protein
MVREGGGAPATTMRVALFGRTSPRSRRLAAASRITATTVGAPQRRVIPSAKMRDRIASPSTLRWTTWRAPIAVRA